MRRSIAKCATTLFALTLVGLILIFVQLVLPTPAFSRQIPSAFEDAGDPDGLDGTAPVTDRFEDLIFSTEVGSSYAPNVTGGRLNSGLQSHFEEDGVLVERGEGRILMALWLLFTFYGF